MSQQMLAAKCFLKVQPLTAPPSHFSHLRTHGWLSRK
jgi:hypothetical protein